MSTSGAWSALIGGLRGAYGGEAGNLVVVPPETPHRYENPGPGSLRVISVHPNGVTIQTNL